VIIFILRTGGEREGSSDDKIIRVTGAKSPLSQFLARAATINFLADFRRARSLKRFNFLASFRWRMQHFSRLSLVEAYVSVRVARDDLSLRARKITWRNLFKTSRVRERRETRGALKLRGRASLQHPVSRIAPAWNDPFRKGVGSQLLAQLAIARIAGASRPFAIISVRGVHPVSKG